VYHDLENSGCIIWSKFIENIEEIYSLSDCYIYPTIDKYDRIGRSVADSIEMPLTVLEAMACNLPVIASEFGALPRCFNEGDGFFYMRNSKDLLSALESIKGNMHVNTKKSIQAYSWKNICSELEKTYEELLET
jgi:glycosyltransferase involved in cell wall biosynthesis